MSDKHYNHNVFWKIKSRLNESRRTIQIILGPRQVGKSWAVNDVLRELSEPYVYGLADEQMPSPGKEWISQLWHEARDKANNGGKVVLVFDEIQKIKEWSSEIKRLWDEDSFKRRNIYVVLLGSSALTLQKGLSESLMGRFEIIWFSHWSYRECREAFGFSPDEYVYFGGYPGAAGFKDDPARWRQYILNGIIEPVLSRDIPLITDVRNPVLLRNLFHLACDYPAQELSYRKIQGQFTDVKSVVTIAGYQRMLEQAYLVQGLQKWSGKSVVKRNSSPKWLPLNTGLVSAVRNQSLGEARQDLAYWGRLVETCVGAHLVNEARVNNYEVYYWREDLHEIDFVLRQGSKLIAIEVKTNFEKHTKAFQMFLKNYPKARTMLVGPDGIKLEEFLTTPLETYLASV